MASRKQGQIISTGALTLLKIKLNSASRGHRLLKTKSDALLMRFRVIAQKYIELKTDLHYLLEDAWFVLVEARYILDGFQRLVLEGPTSATIKITYEEETVVGVTLRNFTVAESDEEPYPLFGLGHGGSHIKIVKDKFRSLTHYIVELAAQQTAFLEVDEALKTTKRRVNALEHVLIPDLEEDIKVINQAIEEQEREEFFRMKKIQKIKRKTTQSMSGHSEKRRKKGKRSRGRSRGRSRRRDFSESGSSDNEKPDDTVLSRPSTSIISGERISSVRSDVYSYSRGRFDVVTGSQLTMSAMPKISPVIRTLPGDKDS